MSLREGAISTSGAADQTPLPRISAASPTVAKEFFRSCRTKHTEQGRARTNPKNSATDGSSSRTAEVTKSVAESKKRTSAPQLFTHSPTNLQRPDAGAADEAGEGVLGAESGPRGAINFLRRRAAKATRALGEMGEAGTKNTLTEGFPVVTMGGVAQNGKTGVEIPVNLGDIASPDSLRAKLGSMLKRSIVKSSRVDRARTMQFDYSMRRMLMERASSLMPGESALADSAQTTRAAIDAAPDWLTAQTKFSDSLLDAAAKLYDEIGADDALDRVKVRVPVSYLDQAVVKSGDALHGCENPGEWGEISARDALERAKSYRRVVRGTKDPVMRAFATDAQIVFRHATEEALAASGLGNMVEKLQLADSAWSAGRAGEEAAEIFGDHLIGERPGAEVPSVAQEPLYFSSRGVASKLKLGTDPSRKFLGKWLGENGAKQMEALLRISRNAEGAPRTPGEFSMAFGVNEPAYEGIRGAMEANPTMAARGGLGMLGVWGASRLLESTFGRGVLIGLLRAEKMGASTAPWLARAQMVLRASKIADSYGAVLH